MSAATLEKWIEAVFDHPVGKPEWYWENDFDDWWAGLGLSDSVTVEYMSRLFLRPDSLNAHSLEQVAQGIWFLIGESSPAQSAHTLLKSDVPSTNGPTA
jgi:hypothetical protein